MTNRKLTIATLTLTLAAFAFAAPGLAQSAMTPSECSAAPITDDSARGMSFSLRVRLLRALGVNLGHRMAPAKQVRELTELIQDGDSVASILGCQPPTSGGGFTGRRLP